MDQKPASWIDYYAGDAAGAKTFILAQARALDSTTRTREKLVTWTQSGYSPTHTLVMVSETDLPPTTLQALHYAEFQRIRPRRITNFLVASSETRICSITSPEFCSTNF